MNGTMWPAVISMATSVDHSVPRSYCEWSDISNSVRPKCTLSSCFKFILDTTSLSGLSALSTEYKRVFLSDLYSVCARDAGRIPPLGQTNQLSISISRAPV